MLSGIYRVSFQSPIASGKGIVYGKNGTLVGGDTGFVYRGTFQANGNQVTAKLRIVQDDPSMQSVFGPLKDFELNVSGQASDGSFNLAGSVVGQPQLQISVQGTKMAD